MIVYIFERNLEPANRQTKYQKFKDIEKAREYLKDKEQITEDEEHTLRKIYIFGDEYVYCPPIFRKDYYRKRKWYSIVFEDNFFMYLQEKNCLLNFEQFKQGEIVYVKHS